MLLMLRLRRDLFAPSPFVPRYFMFRGGRETVGADEAVVLRLMGKNVNWLRMARCIGLLRRDRERLVSINRVCIVRVCVFGAPRFASVVRA